MKKVSILFILTGLLLFVYPAIENAYSQYRENMLLREYENIMASTTPDNFLAQDEPNLIEPNDEEEQKEEKGKTEPDSNQDETYEDVLENHTGAIGIIRLPKIDIHLPILYNATNTNLKYGAAQLKGSTPIGQIGNTAIAGHRNYTDERLFANLHRLTPEDEIIIETTSGVFTYTVFNTLVVEPTDTSILNKSTEEKILTLITCDPPEIASHRLIVQAKIMA